MIWVPTDDEVDLDSMRDPSGAWPPRAWRLMRGGEAVLLAGIDDRNEVFAQPAAGIGREIVEVPEIADAVGELVVALKVRWSTDSIPDEREASLAMRMRILDVQVVP